MKKVITTAIAAATISACTPVDPTFSSFFSEAGASLDSGDFGEATRNNRLIQTGELDYTVNLARRFAADVDSTVNFAFDSTVLDADATYRINLVNRNTLHRLSRGTTALKTDALELSGSYLMRHGVTLPWSFPERMWVVEGQKL